MLNNSVAHYREDTRHKTNAVISYFRWYLGVFPHTLVQYYKCEEPVYAECLQMREIGSVLAGPSRKRVYWNLPGSWGF